MVITDQIEKTELVNEAWQLLEKVKDPEIPVLSVVELGMIEDVRLKDGNILYVRMLPTFVACPAISIMRNDIIERLKVLKVKDVEVELVKEIKWTSDRITDKGRKLLEDFGLGTSPKHHGKVNVAAIAQAKCPQCKSTNTSLTSPFGSTLCRSIHKCAQCGHSFERFKPI